MTEPRGAVFVSYRRQRLAETSRLVRTLHDRGIPTWRDVDSLANEPTEAAVRAALADPHTSGAILWLTPDVEESRIINAVEVPLAIERKERGDGFWVVIVLADGLDYGQTTTLFADTLGGTNLADWNLTKVASPRASARDINDIAASVLRERLKAIKTAQIDPVRVVAHAKGTVVHHADNALTLDWTPYYANGAPKLADWRAMSRAATQVSTELKRTFSRGDLVQVSGTPSLPAAFLVGSTFSSRDGFNPDWIQRDPSGSREDLWSMAQSADAQVAAAGGWTGGLHYGDLNASALAVHVNISDNVSEQFARSRDQLPSWRAIVRITSSTRRNTRAHPLTPEETASLVHLTVDKVREARSSIQGLESVHLFIAGPAGFAFLLGTMVATLPPLTAYEYMTQARHYVPSISVST